MKKFMIALGLALAALMLFYGVVSSLVNKGYGLAESIAIFVMVSTGGALLVWFLGKDKTS